MMAGVGGIAGRLYRGEVSINFVRRQRMWYTISGLILLISVVALLVKGLDFSVDFKGGSTFQFPISATAGSGSAVQGEISRVVTQAGGGDSVVQTASSAILGKSWLVTTKALPSTPGNNVTNTVAIALENAFHINPAQMTENFVGPTWGSQITTKAVEALIIFLVVIVAYLSIAFEWRMAIAAFVALMHDIVITIGVYALTGFQVSPTTVIGLLTILGYSLYDTVVVFDKVRENTAGLLTSQRSTYSDAANLALNQTLVRSINTSVTALIPVASILFIGAGLLGAGTLKDLALVLFVGMLSGAYSSICIATPVLADLKERQPEYKDLAVKVKRRLAGGRRAGQRVLAAELAEDDLVDDNLIDRSGGKGVAGLFRGDTGKLSGPDNDAVLADDAAIANDLDDPGGATARDGNADSDDDGVTVPPRARPADAARPANASGSGSGSANTGASPRSSRPQPRTGGSAQRRPGPRKKRR
jgi:preprotein translocase subunit SecF